MSILEIALVAYEMLMLSTDGGDQLCGVVCLAVALEVSSVLFLNFKLILINFFTTCKTFLCIL